MTDDALSSLARWHATVTYRTDAGPLDVPMLLREVWDLHDRIEQGPHWDTIEKIEILRATGRLGNSWFPVPWFLCVHRKASSPPLTARRYWAPQARPALTPTSGSPRIPKR